MTYKFQYASDLHLETYDKHTSKLFETLLKPSADYLILAGDIGWPTKSYMNLFLKWCSENWKMIFWVFGNHEYYNKYDSKKWGYKKPESMKYREDIAKHLCSSYNNIILLLNDTYLLKDNFSIEPILIIGTTLWTSLTSREASLISSEFNDFKYICENDDGNLTPFTTNSWINFHKEQMDFLNNAVIKANHESVKCLIITHHLPSYSLIDSKYTNDPMNCGFASRLDDFILSNSCILGWICGHSHSFINREIIRPDESVVFLGLNARGYKFEKSDSYSKSATFILPFTKEIDLSINNIIDKEK